VLVVDVDAHYSDDHRDFIPYMEEPARTQIAKMNPRFLYPSTTGDRQVSGRIVYGGRKGPKSTIDSSGYDTPTDAIAATMELLGVDITVELPNVFLELPRIRRRDIAVALANGYVKFMLDKVVDPKLGIYTMLIPPPQDIKRAVQLIHEVGEHPGVCAVCMVPVMAEPPLGDRYYDPIYRAAQDLRLPIVFHGNTPGIDEFPIAGLQKFLEAHTLGFLFYNMATLVSVVVQGLPERFPGLKFVFQECGLSYVPTVMLRLDTSYRKRRSEAPLLKKLPSEYIREFYYGTQPLEEPNTPQEQAFLAATYNAIDGANTLMFATDYPHWDYNNVKVINRMPFITKEDREKILSGNALKVFRFNGFDLETARSRRARTAGIDAVASAPD
jgi:predicted TIM-barrel fold metal-dependent hydrolase